MSQRVSESASQRVSGSAGQRNGKAARTRHFRDLIAWQKAMRLAREVYAFSSAFPKVEQFGLTAQIRRAAVSVPSNIAEGHGRLTDKGFRVFLAQARGSVFEVETQLQLAIDLGYGEALSAEPLRADCNEVARILNGLLRSLEESEGVTAIG